MPSVGEADKIIESLKKLIFDLTLDPAIKLDSNDTFAYTLSVFKLRFDSPEPILKTWHPEKMIVKIIIQNLLI